MLNLMPRRTPTFPWTPRKVDDLDPAGCSQAALFSHFSGLPYNLAAIPRGRCQAWPQGAWEYDAASDGAWIIHEETVGRDPDSGEMVVALDRRVGAAPLSPSELPFAERQRASKLLNKSSIGDLVKKFTANG